MNPKTLSALALLIIALSAPSLADHRIDASNVDDADIDEITVTGRRLSTEWATIAVAEQPAVDAADVLRRLPGADRNANGRLSNIAQYRGMFGDRVAVTIDDLGVVSGGPNAMDAPLSYVSPMITETLTVERGVSSVASAHDAIGGHVGAKLARGAFGQDQGFGLSGMAGVRYADNGNTSTTAARASLANDSHRFSLLGQFDRGDDLSTPAGRITPSELSRDRYDVSYGYQGERTTFLVYAGELRTRDTGTPALAMDIDYIDTSLYGAKLSRDVAANATVSARIGYNDVLHGMNNFSLRPPPDSPMRYRENTTAGSGINYAVDAEFGFGDYALVTGVDGRTAAHDARITNPNNAMFFITAFNDVERDVLSGFAALRHSADATNWEIGLRYTNVSANAGNVGAGGMMGMMGSNAGALADAFNAADRDLEFNNVDAVVKYARQVTGNVTINVDAGTKTRAPSYQELYLWLPLAATGGLADGRNYVGNLGLRSERSVEIATGFEWETETFSISPQLYYKDVNDYIQGVPATSMPANMLASMMGGEGALMFDNVDAEIYGFDVGWDVEVTSKIRIDGALNYSRGKRTDVDDNLYRLPPLNGILGLSFSESAWAIRGEMIAYAGQEKVSAYNGEQATAGYAIANAMITWSPWSNTRLELKGTNLFDRGYQDHLAGINRVSDSDIPVGTRLYGAGRTIVLGALLSF